MLCDILNKYAAVGSTPEELYKDLFHIGEHYIQRQGEYRMEAKISKGIRSFMSMIGKTIRER